MKTIKYVTVVLISIILVIVVLLSIGTIRKYANWTEPKNEVTTTVGTNLSKIATTKKTNDKNKSKTTSRSGSVKKRTAKVKTVLKPTYKNVPLEYSKKYNVCSSPLTTSRGVKYFNGHKETYYSQRVLPGKGLKKLNSNGRHVAKDGTIRDKDGYIAVACNYLSKGSRIMTSLGPGKVYDTGGMTGKWIDIYVNW